MGMLAGFTISRNMHLEDMQLGYSMDSNGRSLVGTNHGKWRENWFVIGYHDESGDPIFIVINKKSFSVYTAEHGIGEWNSKAITSSFIGFIKISNYLAELSKRTEDTLTNRNSQLSMWTR
ncbi:hypothetical protein P4654_10895 [Niallia taxi]|uniref:hypothetical protein n=1 Tax=Niallia taxi TaxID=2499688 RepID=UPI002E1EC127|nr:hypothetical protein [Niallia taxi]MED4121956.1 hypothetical protein [Niallia taxi]